MRIIGDKTAASSNRRKESGALVGEDLAGVERTDGNRAILGNQACDLKLQVARASDAQEGREVGTITEGTRVVEFIVQATDELRHGQTIARADLFNVFQ